MRYVVPDDVQCQQCNGLAKTDQLALGARPRREALRSDMERFEQVRLADAVVADDQDDARRETEVEGGVGAIVPERDVRDDQPVVAA
jgi:hypothetical protein